MTENDVTNWILVDYTATSLYSVIADGNYRKTNVGRAGWKSLVNGARLQPHCNKEGFNVRSGSNRKSRIGILADNKNVNRIDTDREDGKVLTYDLYSSYGL